MHFLRLLQFAEGAFGGNKFHIYSFGSKGLGYSCGQNDAVLLAVTEKNQTHSLSSLSVLQKRGKFQWRPSVVVCQQNIGAKFEKQNYHFDIGLGHRTM